MTEANATPLAPLPTRFGALMIDWVICLVVGLLFGPIAERPWVPSLALVLMYGVAGITGQTAGMAITRIRCVSTADGSRPIGVLRGLLRGVLLALLVPALIMDTYGRGLHDKAAGSVMLAKPTGPGA